MVDLGGILEVLNPGKNDVESNLNLEAPPGDPRRERTHPRGANEPLFGPGGRLQRGVLSLRTSEFWRPVLGDLEAKDPGHQYLSD